MPAQADYLFDRVNVTREGAMWRFGAVLILATSLGGCGESLDDDVATEASAITAIIVGARPMADAVFDPPDYYPPWSVQPSSRARFDAINETTCNNATDYIYTGPRTISAGAAFDIDVSAIPRGKTVSSMRAFVCARPHIQAAISSFQGRVHYWNPAGDGQRKFLGNYGDDYRLPLVGFFGSNPFRLYEVATAVLISISPTAKPATGGMRLRLWGDNVEVSQVYLSIGYPTDAPPPF